MRSVWVVARWELRRTVARRGFLIATAAMPVLLLVGVLLLTLLGDRIGDSIAGAFDESGDAKADRYAVIDHSGLLTDLPASGQLVAFADVSAARADVAAGRLRGYFVVPADYIESGRVTLVTAEFGTFGLDDDAEPTISRALQAALLGSRLTPQEAARVVAPVRLQALDLAGESEPSVGSTVIGFVVPYAMALLFVIAIFVSSGYLLQGVGEEKESRVIEVVLSSVTPDELLIGKVLGQGIAGLSQILVWVISGLIVLPILLGQIDDPGEVNISVAVLPIGIAYFVLGYFLMASVYAAFGAVAPTSREGQQIAGWSAIIVVVPLMLNQLIIIDPDGALAVVLSLIPFTAPATGLLRMAAGSSDALTIGISLALLAISVPVMLWVSTRIFRVGLLVYGRRLRLRDIVVAMRG